MEAVDHQRGAAGARTGADGVEEDEARRRIAERLVRMRDLRPRRLARHPRIRPRDQVEHLAVAGLADRPVAAGDPQPSLPSRPEPRSAWRCRDRAAPAANGTASRRPRPPRRKKSGQAARSDRCSTVAAGTGPGLNQCRHGLPGIPNRNARHGRHPRRHAPRPPTTSIELARTLAATSAGVSHLLPEAVSPHRSHSQASRSQRVESFPVRPSASSTAMRSPSARMARIGAACEAAWSVGGMFWRVEHRGVPCG